MVILIVDYFIPWMINFTQNRVCEGGKNRASNFNIEKGVKKDENKKNVDVLFAMHTFSTRCM